MYGCPMQYSPAIARDQWAGRVSGQDDCKVGVWSVFRCKQPCLRPEGKGRKHGPDPLVSDFAVLLGVPGAHTSAGQYVSRRCRGDMAELVRGRRCRNTNSGRRALMSTTIFLEGKRNPHLGRAAPLPAARDELLGRYQQILDEQRLSWTEHHRLMRLLGSGGQGVVYLSRAPRHRQFHAAGGVEDLFARTLRGRAVVRRGDGPDGGGRRPRGPDPARQSASTSTTGSIAAASA